MTNQPVEKFNFVINKNANSGESLVFSTNFYEDDAENIYLKQTLTLNSYNNSVSFNLGTEITPKILRNLADELEKRLKKLYNK